jgi:hypothetical protein
MTLQVTPLLVGVDGAPNVKSHSQSLHGGMVDGGMVDGGMALMVSGIASSMCMYCETPYN